MAEIDLDRLLTSYEYNLPADRIAQNPLLPRDSSRLLVVDSPHTGLEKPPQHKIFRELPDLLQPGDLLVLNNTRVIPARLYGRKLSGASVEVLLIEEKSDNCWLALVKPGRRLPPGAKILFALNQSNLIINEGQISNQLSATVLAKDEATGGRLLQFDIPVGKSLMQILPFYGEIPLPPYITASEAEMTQYQTVYADRAGAIAAPTAGLHFTDELLNRCTQRGIAHTFVTLHVGVGTFRPVEVDDITTHQMHGEWAEVSPATVQQIQETKSQGGRIIAVGTTVVRSLEGAALSGKLEPLYDKTQLFIYPGYQWRVVDGLITNFHLPRSSLLMLVGAMIGRVRLLNLYQEAIAKEYRFYSFGDAMLILPEAREQK